jgi:CheY-like chemotaxis protein
LIIVKLSAKGRSVLVHLLATSYFRSILLADAGPEDEKLSEKFSGKETAMKSIIAEASNGRESIHEFRTLRPDATLMDLPMPEMEWPRCDHRASG